jgi:type IV secretion system protein VirB10
MPSDSSGAAGTSAQGEDDATKARREAWQTYYTQVAQLQKDRLTAATSAMTADTGLGNNSGSQTGASGNGVPGAAGGPASFPGGVAPGMSVGAPGAVPGAFPGGFGLPAYPPARVDASAQREKQAFLNQPGDVTGSSDDLQAALRDPSSPFLVMAGTAIPAVMIGGINSDMPGMVIGQVSENVYDTATC